MKIPKSRIWTSFAADVAAHAKEMGDWRAHMKRVDADEKNGVTGIAKHMAHPRPSAHPLVESAVNEHDVADFEIVDDGPTSAQRLAAKKAELLGRVSQAERAAVNAVLPIGKRRLFDMREQDIRSGIVQPSVLGKIKNAIAGSGKSIPQEDEQFLADQQARREAAAVITRKAAQAHHDIEDLTLDNIDTWQLPVLS